VRDGVRQPVFLFEEGQASIVEGAEAEGMVWVRVPGDLLGVILSFSGALGYRDNLSRLVDLRTWKAGHDQNETLQATSRIPSNTTGGAVEVEAPWVSVLECSGCWSLKTVSEDNRL